MKKLLAYCSCGHSETKHTLFEDVDPESGQADARCKLCGCNRFDYDSRLSDVRDEQARDMALRWRDEK